MRLTSIRLHPFGTFRDTSWDLSSPLVVISGPNETGKSTLRQAIFHSLFTPTDLTPARLRDLISPWFPLPGGDYASITVGIEHNGNHYQLQKRWGSQPASSLTTPDGSELGETQTIAAILEQLCGHNEATYRHVFFTGHDELESTIAKLDAHAFDLRDIRSLAQTGKETTGDVDQRRLEQVLEDRIKSYFSRWDDTRQRPIRQNGQEKVIGNEWKQGVGKILTAWYTWQRLVEERKTIHSLEKEIDLLTSQLLAIEAQIKTDRDFLGRFGFMRDQLAERRIMEERVTRLTGEAGILKKAFAAWPTAKAAVDAWETQRKTLITQANKLQDELGTARAREQATGFTASYTAIQAAKNSMAEALGAVDDQPLLAPDTLSRIENLDSEIVSLSHKLAAHSLTYSIESQSNKSALVTDANQPPKPIELGDDPIIGTASGRVRIETSDLIITVDSGEENIQTVLENLNTKRESLQQLLEKCKVASVAKAKEQASRHADLTHRLKTKQETYRALLQDKTQSEWDQEFKALESLPQTRESKSIEQELETLRHSVATNENAIEMHHQNLLVWEQAHTDLETLGEKLLIAQQNLRTTESKLTSLPEVPSEFSSIDKFLHSLDSAQERMNAGSEPRSQLGSKRGTLEGQLGERRSEDLTEEAEHARFQFERILEEGNCYKRIEKTLAQVSPNASDSLDHLSKRITEIFSSISCSDSQLEFNDTLPSHITRGLVTLSPDRLSQGARGALAIAIRIALAESYLQSSNGFVMLDDPFVHMDTDRLGQAISVVKSFSEKHPVIFFTCHENQASLLLR